MKKTMLEKGMQKTLKRAKHGPKTGAKIMKNR